MDALSSLAMYSDSDEEEDDENDHTMAEKPHPTITLPISLDAYQSSSKSASSSQPPERHLNGNGIQLTDTRIDHLHAPSIPSSPDIPAQEEEQQIISNLLDKHESHERYLQHTFQCSEFQDNPEIFAMLQSKLQLFQYNEMEQQTQWNQDTDYKLDEYASALPLAIHNPNAFRDKEDNVDTLMRFLEEKIRENERRMQEKRERKEKQKQLMMKERAERRVPTPSKTTMTSQRYPHQQTLNALNAAKQAVLAQKSQFRMHRKERHSKRSRWDDQ